MGLLAIATVEQASVGIVERFGKLQRILDPGLHFIRVGKLIGTLSLRVQQLDVRCETKTLDNVFVTVVLSIQYEVIKEKIYEAFYSLEQPQQQIKSYVFDVIRSTVPKIKVDDVFTTKEEIAHAVKAELSSLMRNYGYNILQSLVTDIEPNSKVKNAMNEINTSERQLVAAMNQAEAAKQQRIKQAEANAEAQILNGKALARQRDHILQSVQLNIRDLLKRCPNLRCDDAVQMFLTTQYYDMIRETSSAERPIIIPHGPPMDIELQNKRDATL